MSLTIGVLSDTHGDLHPRVLPVFRAAGVERILHAGDVGRYAVIAELSKLAPVTAVCGNVDVEGNVAMLPGEVSLDWEGVSLYMTHVGGKPGAWLPRLPSPLPEVAICGHSHIPMLVREGGVLFLNPGAAGTRPRFGTPLSAALLRLEKGAAQGELITL
jgi:putative phosphoesterase